MAGHTSIMLQVIEVYLVDVPIRLQELQDALDNKNTVNVEQALHSIKGVSGNVGGLRLHQLVGLLEHDIKTHDLQFPELQKKSPSFLMPIKTYVT